MSSRQSITIENLETCTKYLVRIAELTGIPVDEVMCGRHTAEITDARSLLAWALTDLCGYSTTKVGILIRRHYTSVIYLRKRLTTAIRLPVPLVAIMENLKAYNEQLKHQQNETKAQNGH